MTHPPCDCRRCGRASDIPCSCGECREPRPCPPPRPRPRPRKPCQQSVLLQKILCCERRSYPELCAELTLKDVPACAERPLKLTMVQQSGAQPWWTPLETHLDGRLRVRVFIPVCCQVCDACGKLYYATSVVSVEASLRPCCPISECWRYSLLVMPCVRLCQPECRAECDTFCARLEVMLEIYMLRPEPCAMRRPEPECPELPLYPPPIQPAQCWPQCQPAPAPCGWPRQG